MENFTIRPVLRQKKMYRCALAHIHLNAYLPLPFLFQLAPAPTVSQEMFNENLFVKILTNV